MDFGLTDEQRAMVATTRAFVERELYPHEEEVERTGVLRPELADEITAEGAQARAVRRQHARGGRRCRPRHGDLGALREGARARPTTRCTTLRRPALRTSCWRAPRRRRRSTSTRACAASGVDCLAMTEPGAGSDLRGMRTRAGPRRRAAGGSRAPSTSSATPTRPTS